MIIKQKYNIGDKVWVVEDRQAVEKVITGIFFKKENNSLFYKFDFREYSDTHEKYVFSTKEELIKSL